MSAVAPSSPPPRRLWTSIQLFVLDELPAIGIVAGAVAATVSRIVPAFESVTIPALVSVVVGVALRVLRGKYELAAVSADLRAEVAKVADLIGDLRNAVVSPETHQAERCTRAGFYRRMLAALEGAEQTVDLTQLDKHAPRHYGTPAMVAYFNRQKEIVAERPHVQFRRIVAVPTLEKLDWLLSVLEANADRPNFQISVLDLPDRDQPAPLSLQIFDRNELCLVDPTVGSMLPGEQENMLWVSGRAVADVFSIYYNDLWAKSTPLKEGPLIDIKVLHDLLVRLRPSGSSERELASALGSRVRALAQRQTGLAEAG